MLLDQLFPHQVCINLERRPGRWRRMQAEFSHHGIQSVRHFPAVDGETVKLPADWRHTAGAYGCLLSHLAVVQEARRLNQKSVLIFEDDTVFDPEFKTKFPSFVAALPPDWDMLYFGALHKDEPLEVRERIYRIVNANSTFAYALKHTVYDAFIELNRRAGHVLDVNAYQLQERFNCYCFMPNLAWVEPEYSDVQNRLERHWYLEKSLVLFGAHVDRLLSRTAIVLAHRGPAGKNLSFLQRHYAEYFAPLVEIVVAPDFRDGIARADSQRQFLILSDGDLYLETLDLRANLLMCEKHGGATGFNEVIDLTSEQADLLRRTGLTRGIDVSKSIPASRANSELRFIKRAALDAVVSPFQSPNHVLRLPRS